MAGRTGIFAVAAAREVRRRVVLAWIAHTGRQIQASTDDPALSTGSLLRAVGESLRQLERDPLPEPHHHAQMITTPGLGATWHGAPERAHAPDREAAR
jgi:hypothetical protein